MLTTSIVIGSLVLITTVTYAIKYYREKENRQATYIKYASTLEYAKTLETDKQVLLSDLESLTIAYNNQLTATAVAQNEAYALRDQLAVVTKKASRKLPTLAAPREEAKKRQPRTRPNPTK